jgi:hypothetical protein
MYQDIYRSAAEDNVRTMRKRALEHQLYLKTKKEKKSIHQKRFFGISKGA